MQFILCTLAPCLLNYCSDIISTYR